MSLFLERLLRPSYWLTLGAVAGFLVLGVAMMPPHA